MILATTSLNASYNNQQILHNISFSLEEGEILCLLGASGSGKTTLLRTIAGLHAQDSGTIHFRNQEITSLAAHKREFGMMFQDYALFPHKNVAENIAFGLQIQHLPKQKRQERIHEMLTLVGLDGYESRKITELSGGQQQRVALARSLAPRPHLLLLDEPLGSLDRRLRDHLAIELRTILKKLGMTAIFVTHDQSEAFGMADRIAILLQGEIAQIDSPENIYQHPATREVGEFLGFKNFLSGKVEGSFFCCSQNLGDYSKIALPEKKMVEFASTSSRETTLLIRPEGVQLAAEGQKPQLCGRVVERTCLGASYRIVFLCGETELLFFLPLQPAPPAVGEEAALLLHENSLIVLL